MLWKDAELAVTSLAAVKEPDIVFKPCCEKLLSAPDPWHDRVQLLLYSLLSGTGASLCTNVTKWKALQDKKREATADACAHAAVSENLPAQGLGCQDELML